MFKEFLSVIPHADMCVSHKSNFLKNSPISYDLRSGIVTPRIMRRVSEVMLKGTGAQYRENRKLRALRENSLLAKTMNSAR